VIKIWLLVVWFNASGNYVYLPTVITDFPSRQSCEKALYDFKVEQKAAQGVCVEKPIPYK